MHVSLTGAQLIGGIDAGVVFLGEGEMKKRKGNDRHTRKQAEEFTWTQT